MQDELQERFRDVFLELTLIEVPEVASGDKERVISTTTFDLGDIEVVTKMFVGCEFMQLEEVPPVSPWEAMRWKRRLRVLDLSRGRVRHIMYGITDAGYSLDRGPPRDDTQVNGDVWMALELY